jgi:putative ABC transport system permease protein
VLALFVPLDLLQRDLDISDRVNVMLVSGGGSVAGLEALVGRHAALRDFGLSVRVLEGPRAISLESDAGLIDEARAKSGAEVAQTLGLSSSPVLTYLANTIRSGTREMPYSLVTALDLQDVAIGIQRDRDLPPIVLNEWAARDLAATEGSEVTLEYDVWEDPGRLASRTATFYVAAIVPITRLAADRDLAPAYPGITGSETVRDWDPPFPIDLRRIRPIDEEYWQKYRTTPKAFVPLDVGQRLWRSRYGSMTSIRLAPPRGERVALDQVRDQYANALRATLDPIAAGLAVRSTRSDALAASRGATDFGEYFAYFSFFLVASALVLAALFFKLGIEQRVREVGLLKAVGYETTTIRRLFATEALVLSLAGSAIGLAGAIGYGQLMMTGLRTWWVDAVGTTSLTLHVSARSLLAGAGGGIVAALICVWWTLRMLSRVSERSLLAGELERDDVTVRLKPDTTYASTMARSRGPLVGAIALAALGVLLLGLGATDRIGQTGAFFGAGASLLAASLCGLTLWLRRPPRQTLSGRGWWPVSKLGLRSASYRPMRSVLSMAVVASATFILISVDAFRQTGSANASDRQSGTGGYAVFVDTMLPLVDDPNSAAGRELLGLSSFDPLAIAPFRVLPGDDVSCLNLYEPRNPRILGVGHEFVAENRFTFQRSLAGSDEERTNPWQLLEQKQPDGAVPVIVDANSMTYVLHKTLGDDVVIDRAGQPVTLRIVAALSDSIFQSELLMSEVNFRQLFPDQQGYQLLLIAAPDDRTDEVVAAVEDRLTDSGADAIAAGERLAAFHKVENTYLSTFQTLGGLGLLLGTIGLSAVMLRNVLERRRELALLGAVGYGRGQLVTIVMAESFVMIGCGLAAGAVCALVAIAPAAAERGGRLPTGAGLWLLLFAVLATGLVSSLIAATAAIQSQLLEALRAE